MHPRTPAQASHPRRAATTRTPPRTALALASVLAMGTVASGQTWSFTRIARTGEQMPATSFQFNTFSFPSLHGDTVAFAGFGTGGHQGVYTGSGPGLTVVADRLTASPNGVNFVGFGAGSGLRPDIDGSSTVFNAGDGIEGGLFLRAGAQITRVATTSTSIPGGIGTLWTIGPGSVEAGRVAFVGRDQADAQRGVFSWESGALSVIADRSTPVPSGPGTFTDFLDSDVDGPHTVFSGASGNFLGIYRATGGTITRLYDSNTPSPSGGSFGPMGNVVTDNGRVAFYAQGTVAEGIYSDVSGSLEVVADQFTQIPGRLPGVTFGGLGYVSIDNANLAFMGYDASGATGVFSTHTGTLSKVLAHGDPLDGRTVFDAFVGSHALSGNNIAIFVEFTDGTYGIYRATIPAPVTAAPLALAALSAHRRGRAPRPRSGP